MPCLTRGLPMMVILTVLCRSVYLALWNETPVAVKMLVRGMSEVQSLDVEEDAEAAAGVAMSFAAPILASLQKVSSANCGSVLKTQVHSRLHTSLIAAHGLQKHLRSLWSCRRLVSWQPCATRTWCRSLASSR